MQITIDPDVGQAAAYLSRTFEAAKLVQIAEALARLAPALWGHYGEIAKLRPVELLAAPIKDCAERKSQAASG